MTFFWVEISETFKKKPREFVWNKVGNFLRMLDGKESKFFFFKFLHWRVTFGITFDAKGPRSISPYATFAFLSNELQCIKDIGLKYFVIMKCRVFCLNSTPFIPQVEQHKLDPCSMGWLSKTLQRLCYRHFNFLFSKNSYLRSINGEDV